MQIDPIKYNFKETYLKHEKVMIVRTNPNIDTPHPIHVTTEIASLSRLDNLLALVCDISSIKAKFVKWSHVQLTYPSYFWIVDTSHPSFDHAPKTPRTEVAKLNPNAVLY